MKKSLYKIFGLLFTLLFVFQSAHVLVYADSDRTGNDTIDTQETALLGNTTCTAETTPAAYFNCDSYRYLITDTIVATLHISQPIEESQIFYDNDGFVIEQILKINDTSYSIQLKMQQVSAATLNVHLFSAEEVCTSLSAISTDKGVFVSPISIHEAWRAYYYSEVEDGVYTISEFHKIMSDYALMLNPPIPNTHLNQTDSINSDNSTMGIVPPMPMITISGTLSFLPYRNSTRTNHLKFIFIEVYVITSSSQTLQYQGYTNSNGYFSFDYHQSQNETINLRLKIYARGEYVSVRDTQNIEYCYVMDKTNCSLEYDIDLSTTVITDADDSTSQSIEVAQALIYGTKYSRSQNGEYLDSVCVYFPFIPTPSQKTSHYIANTNSIYLTSGSYNDWDALLHEYGHHIQHQLGLNSTWGGGEHKMERDLTTYEEYNYSKLKAIHLAWSEALASMFSQLCQMQYPSSNDSVAGYADATHSGVDLEKAEFGSSQTVDFGEACEGRILSLLWDIYDSNSLTEEYDTLSFTNAAIWDLLTHQIAGFENTTVETLSDFCSYFLEVYPEYLEDFSALLSHHGIGVSNVTITNHANGSQTISWTANGMVNLPNNYFAIAIVDSTTSEALYQVVVQNCNVLLSPSTVNNLESHSYYIIIFAYQMNDLISTGPYTCYYNIS